jgi:hypothetical protein
MGLSLQHLLRMQMKQEVCLTGLLLGTNHGCNTTNPIQSVLSLYNCRRPLALLPPDLSLVVAPSAFRSSLLNGDEFGKGGVLLFGRQ